MSSTRPLRAAPFRRGVLSGLSLMTIMGVGGPAMSAFAQTARSPHSAQPSAVERHAADVKFSLCVLPVT